MATMQISGDKKTSAEFHVRKPQTPEADFPVRGQRKEYFALNLSNRVQIKHNKPPKFKKSSYLRTSNPYPKVNFMRGS